MRSTASRREIDKRVGEVEGERDQGKMRGGREGGREEGEGGRKE